MKRYGVIIEDSAKLDVQDSYNWGCRVWGAERAQKWMRELRGAIVKKLALAPLGFPVAPETDEFEEEIRQMIVGRYRVLFCVRSRKVHVLHIRGAYIETLKPDTED
ncbi:MAG TPA: type II toxin-antitoxin system RelE/ParE family toxin [Blastocatellia bacterium]|nr:type II toxin-antitoxin system RelE/ParE family toxin [Blastocatellia bacterium]